MIRERLVAWADYFGAVGFALWVAAGILLIWGNQPIERIVVLLVLGVIAFGIFVYAKFALVKAVVTSRSARYGSNTVIISAAFIGIVAIIAFLSGRYVYRYDTTANQDFTLSPLTIQALQSLKEPVTVTAFYSFQNDQTGQLQTAQDKLNEYKNVNPEKLNYKFVDPDADPQIATDYNILGYGTIVFERGKRRENVFAPDEQSLTNALLKVSQDTQPTLYFTTGHGERSVSDTGDTGYSSLKDGVENLNYKTASLDLKTVTDTLPSDITALVIAGPVSPFDPAEIKSIQNYIAKNGQVLIMLDPTTQTGLENMLKNYGLTVRNDLVYDPKYGLFGRAQIPVINSFNSHTITQNLTGQNLVFPGARSMVVNTGVLSYTVTALFSTSDASWGETDFDSVKNQTAKYDEGKDTKGPLDLGYTIEGTGGSTARLVVLGNSSALANANLKPLVTSTGQQVQFGNGALFVNALRWFTGQENLITIPPKATTPRQLTLTAEDSNFVLVFSVLLLPLFILLIGGVVWWRRR
jgi:ABC-type uncharacterized transport system involved in gliding motility auxiliary subunit